MPARSVLLIPRERRESRSGWKAFDHCARAVRKPKPWCWTLLGRILFGPGWKDDKASLKRMMRSQRASRAERASWEEVKTSGMCASSLAVEAASDGDEGDCGDVGSLLLGERRITYGCGKWKAISYDFA